MRRYWLSGMAVVVLALGSIAAAPTGEWQQWPARMQVLRSALTQLMLDASTPTEFARREHAERVAAGIQVIAQHAEYLAKSPQQARPDTDASMPIVLRLLAGEMRNAYEKFQSGHTEYARETVRSATGYCISCHTRDRSGPALMGNAQVRELRTMSRVAQAEFYAATRQYDQAGRLFADAVADHRLVKQSPLEWRRALLYGLALTVRAQQNPALALKLIDGASHNPWIDDNLRRDIAVWRAALEVWAVAPTHPLGAAPDDAALLKQLIAAAAKSTTHAADLSGMIYDLRATALAHALLRTAAPGVPSAELLATLGDSYNRLQDMQIWSLHALYYEACVNAAPHTAIARRCANKFSDSIAESYSGSAGTDVPSTEQARVTALRALAK